MPSNKKILFISHDASRTGAPILLLRFMEALKSKGEHFEIDVIVRNGGPLNNKFEQCGRLLALTEGGGVSISDKILNRLTRGKWKNFLTGSKFNKFLRPHYDCVISNTIINGSILKYVNSRAKQIVTYVHELEFTIKNFVSENDLEKTLALSDHFFVPCQVVADNLIINHKVDEDKVSILRYYVPGIIKASSVDTVRKTIKKEFVIGSSGSNGWRKGFDLFVQLAVILRAECKQHNIKFLWIGVDRNSFEFKMAWYDVLKADIESFFIFIAQTDDVAQYINDLDVFVMLSREDPYPVALLEAALYKKPILCFEGSGGANDFLNDGRGIIVPYLDMNSVGAEIMKLYNDANLREQYGEKAFDELKKRHSESGSVDVLTSYLNNLAEC